MPKVERVYGNVGEFITIVDIASHLRLTSDLETEEVNLIPEYVKAAQEYCEDATGKALSEGTYQASYDRWPGAEGFNLMRYPATSITSIKYYDKDNVEGTVDSSDYILDDKSDPSKVYLKWDKLWPANELRTGSPIVITFVAGYADDECPKRYKQAARLLASHYYEAREAAIMPASTGSALGNEIPFGVNVLLRVKDRRYS